MRSVWPMRKLIDEAYCVLIGQHLKPLDLLSQGFRRAAVKASPLIFNFCDSCQISKYQQVKDSNVDCDFELHIHNQIIISLCPTPLTQSYPVFENVRYCMN